MEQNQKAPKTAARSMQKTAVTKPVSTPEKARGGWAKSDPLEMVDDMITAVNSLRSQYEAVIQPDPAVRKTNKLVPEESDNPLDQLGQQLTTAGNSIYDQEYQKTMTFAGATISKMGDNERVMQRQALKTVLRPFRDFVRKQLPKERELLSAEVQKATDATAVKKGETVMAGETFKRVGAKHKKLLRRLMQSQLQYFEDQTKLLQDAIAEIKKTSGPQATEDVRTQLN